MNFNKIKKFLLVLIIGILVFLINSGDVFAYEEDEVLCRYEGSWGKIEIVLGGMGTPVFQYSVTSPTKCGGTVDNSCVDYKFKYSKGTNLDESYYGFQYSSTSGKYVCPRIYYTYEQTTTFLTNKYKKNFTFSPINEYDSYVDSSKGPIADETNVIEKQCDEEQKKEISATYYRQYVADTNQQISDHTKSITGINDWEALKNRLSGTDGNSVRSEYESILNTMVDNFKSVLSTMDCAPDADYINKLAERLRNVVNVMVNEEIGKINQHIRTLELQGKVPEEDQEDIIDIMDDLENDLKNSVDNAVSTIKTKWLAESGIIYVDDSPISCEGLLGSDVLDDISRVLNWIKIGVPILLVLLGSLDFGKAVLADDDKALSKATRTFIMRCIAAVAVFFAPIIIMYLIELVDDLAGGCDISDLYGVILWKI